MGKDNKSKIEITEEDTKVILKADFRMVLELLSLAATFWFTTVEIDREDRHRTRLKVGKIRDIIRIPSIVKILVNKIL